MNVRNIRFFVLLFELIFLLTEFAFAQNLKINEVVSANFASALDEDGDPSDWIEIYNADTSPLNLLNYGLSDNENNLQKWSFPDMVLEPDAFLLVFASGKDRSLTAYWETIIDWGDEWKYFVGTEAPPEDWYQPDFDDTDWLSGPSGFGYGDGDDATIISEIGSNTATSVFIRHAFEVTDLNNITAALLNIDFDDAFVAWLNGVEIARENIGFYGNFPAYNDSVDVTDHEAQLYQGQLPNRYLIENTQSILQVGNNVLVIQTNTIDTDLTMIPFLTLGYATEPATTLYVSQYVEPTLPFLHTNFKLGDDEIVYLSDSAGNEIDQLSAENLQLDVSLGRQPDGSPDLFYFAETTPAASNSTTGSAGVTPDPVIETQAGFYMDPQLISISAAGTGETIWCSLNGAVPSDTSSVSFIYTEPFQLDSTATVRARSFQTGFVPSRTITKTFLLNTDHYMPVISLTTDPYNFFDYYYGIYALGPNATPGFPNIGANFWQDWERPIHLEMFETDHSLVLNTDCGVKIFGFYSRGHAQKSLALFARGQYGDSSFEHQIFEDKPYSSFQSFVLRNSGGDWLWTNVRDGYMADNLKDTNLSYQAFRPAVCYLNGQYWGIYNIREKLSEHFFASNFGADPENIDYLENNRVPLLGDATYYNQIMDYIDTHDLSVQEYYDHVCTLLDIDNYLSYVVAETWYNNTDWPGANYKYWRERTPNGKWRWQIYDLDLGMGLNYENDLNMLDYLLSGEYWGSPYCNEPWATYLIRRLVENDEFVEKLISRYADFMNSIFREEHIDVTIDSLFDYLYDEMEFHMARWGGDFDLWYNNERLVMKWFATGTPGRNDYMRQYIMEQFNLPGTAGVFIDIEPPNTTGTVQVNSLEISEFPWDGIYFQTNPVYLTGLDTPGWEFAGWSGDILSDSTSITLDMAQDYSLIAWFEPVGSFTDSIVFNEINYNSAADFNAEDWVEIFNNSPNDVDMSNWQFKDSEDIHLFEFPQNFILPSQEYFVLCRDNAAFHSLFPDVANFMGNFNFGLSSSGEFIRLFDDTGVLIDSVYYGIEAPWPSQPNGNGPTLSLKNPGMDNSLAASWAASSQHGTPGEINDVYVAADEEIVALSPDLQLLQNFPNPFNPSTKISFSLPNESRINLSIYNIKGQLVKILVNELFNKGIYTVTWDGDDNTGKSVASGIYYYRLSDRHSTRTRKMLLLK
ncbi:MAG: CotH kinase family protein [Candidatus Cloacimonadales bacterium]|nr:CotH kinase family protein [Candidatus Cloacimonadales bacterium]